MKKGAGFFNFSISKILSDDQSILDQARIRLLYYGLVLVFIAVAALLSNIYYQDQPILTITATTLLAFSVIFFKWLTYKPNWKMISHCLLILATLLNFGDIYIIFQTVNIITAQMVILVIIFSFYKLGQGFGLLYSIINLGIILVFLMLQYNT